MFKLLSTLLIVLSLNVYAEPEPKVIVGFGSYHIDKMDHAILNEVNHSIGFELYDIQAIYVSKNSWNEPSVYLTYAPDYKINDYFTTSINLGIATGYKCTSKIKTETGFYVNEYCSASGVVPLGALTLDYSPLANNFAISLSVNPCVAMLSVNYSF